MIKEDSSELEMIADLYEKVAELAKSVSRISGFTVTNTENIGKIAKKVTELLESKHHGK